MAGRGETHSRRTALRLLAIAAAMFGFGYALVPLYNVFCDITGLNGKTGRASAAEAAAGGVDTGRWVTVEFVANQRADLPWEFAPLTRKVRVHPGAVTPVAYRAHNLAPRAITAQAVPSVAPGRAAKYFKKVECFCFTQQTLGAGEARTMPVRFIVERGLPADIDTITLSYTFFPAPPAAGGTAGGQRG